MEYHDHVNLDEITAEDWSKGIDLDGFTEKKWHEGIDLDNINKEEWERIYAEGGFQGEGSGRGSFIENNQYLISWLVNFIKKNNIQNIVDIGCGDFQWMPEVLKGFPNVDYTGIDCVQSIIENHALKYPKYKFICKDITTEKKLLSDSFDLVICKDLLQHNIINPQPVIDYVNNLNAKYRLQITPSYIDINKKYSYSWMLDYESDEMKTIYINQQQNRRGIFARLFSYFK